MIFTGYGALLARSLIESDNAPVRKLGSITSGVGLLLVLVAGFGMMAKLGYSIRTPWLIVKIVIWFALGGIIVLINRRQDLAKKLWWGILALGFLAVLMVFYGRLIS